MRSRRFWLITAALWTLFGLITGFQVWISMITHGHSVPRLVSYYVIVWIAWIGVTAIIVRLAARWPIIPPSRLSIIVHAFAASVVGVAHVAYWLVLLEWMLPFDRMTAASQQLDVAEILFSRLPLELTLYITVLTAVQAIDYYEKYRARTIEAAQLEASLHEARLHALELQLQPHFLFNTLTAVASLVRTGKDDEAVTMIVGLSELLRYTLERSGAPTVTLEEEAHTLRRYLEIQRVRFPDRLAFDIDIADDSRRASVPTLILQPLAENAVRHGISRSAGAGQINVRAFRENNVLRIEMFKTGTLEQTDRRGVGLQNTIERLQQLYPDAHRFELRNEGGGVRTSLTIPWSEVA
jgi:two-component system LytT family sensor kinase